MPDKASSSAAGVNPHDENGGAGSQEGPDAVDQAIDQVAQMGALPPGMVRVDFTISATPQRTIPIAMLLPEDIMAEEALILASEINDCYQKLKARRQATQLVIPMPGLIVPKQ